jgi:ABC-type sugar transport system ATPase subunit
MDVVLSNLEKTYADGTKAVGPLDLTIRSGEFFTLLGPSGCGKTTTLRMVAGLETPTCGRINIGDRDVTALQPGGRNVSMVFQSYALYPHMTARGNLALNLEVHKVARRQIDARVEEVAALLGITNVLGKKPGQLSGGQRQRVALGRALIRRPAVFLLDEPLSNLDLKLREQMRTELKRLHQSLRITTIYVTHDQVEALTMSDRLGVMDHGKLQQVGTPAEVYETPKNVFVAGFIGSPGINLIRLAGDYPGRDALGRLIGDVGHRRAVLLGVRPEDLQVVPPDAGLPCQVEFVEHSGAMVYLFARWPDGEARIRGRAHLIAGVGVHEAVGPGAVIGLVVRPGHGRLFGEDDVVVGAAPAANNLKDGA